MYLCCLSGYDRFVLDVDFDAPKVMVPMMKHGFTVNKGNFLIDFGHFTLHTRVRCLILCIVFSFFLNYYSTTYSMIGAFRGEGAVSLWSIFVIEIEKGVCLQVVRDHAKLKIAGHRMSGFGCLIL